MNQKSDNEEEGEKASDDQASGSMPFFRDMPPRHVKGSRRTVFFFIAVAILLPLVIGGMFYLLRSLQSPGF